MSTTQQLLQQIAALPNTTVTPFRDGGGVQICEQTPNRIKFVSVWTDRRSTVERLQEYLASRAAHA